PDRLEKRVRKPEVKQVLDRLLAEIVIDAIDVALGERAVQRLVELARRREIAAERLLDDHARAVGAARVAQMIGDGREQARRQGEIVQRMRGVAELSAQRLEGRR